ncbi:MAG TPA: AI-2E family transporter [Casimicrobiaceae bacterium]|nr:AI-2E family transporter [Casimicrobiaceae bacterium]
MATRTDEAVVVRRRRPAETALVVLAILAVIAAAKIAEAFIVPVIVGTLLSYSLKPLVAMLERVHIHRVIGAAVVLTLLGAVIAGGVFLLRDDANAALAELPNAARKVRMAARENAQKPEGPIGHVRAAAEELNRAAAEATSGGKTTTPAAAPAPQPTQIQRWITEQSSKALDVIVDIGIAGLLAYFLLAVGDAFRRKLVRVAGPTLTARRITVEILDEIDTQVQRYLLTMLIINTLIGIATWGILAAFGMEHAALWGVTAAVLHIVPYAGSALTILATGFAAFVQFEVVGRALFVAFAVGVAATAIGMGLSAWIQGRAFQINAVTVFVALLFFGWLWGGWGLLVGVPLLAVAKTTIDRLPSLERFIPLLSDEPKTAPAAIAEKR